MCINVVIHAAVEVCMIPCGRYRNEKRVNLYLGLGQGAVKWGRGRGYRNALLGKRHFKREGVGCSVGFQSSVK